MFMGLCLNLTSKDENTSNSMFSCCITDAVTWMLYLKSLNTDAKGSHVCLDSFTFSQNQS